MEVWLQFIVCLVLGSVFDGVRDGTVWHVMRTGKHPPLYRHWHGIKAVSLACYVLAGVFLYQGFGWTLQGLWILCGGALMVSPIVRRTMRLVNYGRLYPDQDRTGLVFWFLVDWAVPFPSKGPLVAYDLVRFVGGLGLSLWVLGGVA